MAGHLHRQPSGAWRLIVYAGTDPITGRKRQVTRTYRGTKKAASEELARLVVAVAEGRATPTRQMTLAELCERWLVQRGPDLSPSTVEAYRRFLRQLPARLAATPIGRIRPADLDGYYTQLRTAGTGVPSIRRRHTFLRSVLQQAVRWQLLAYNPAALATPPPQRHVEPARPDADTVRRLLEVAAAEDEDFAVLMRLAAVSGARRGELVALRWYDVDVDAGVITIHRNAVQIRGQVVYKEPKNGQPRRVPIGAATAAMLTAYRLSLAERMLAFGLPLEPTSPVFQSAPGVAMRPDGVSHRFRRIRALAGANGVRFHGLRHAVATLLHDEGVRDVVVSKRLGHSRLSTTSDLYTGMVDGRDRDAADVMDRLLG